MNVVPLNDKIVVKRLEAERQDGRRHRPAGHRQGKAEAGQGPEPGRRQAAGQPASALPSRSRKATASCSPPTPAVK